MSTPQPQPYSTDPAQPVVVNVVQAPQTKGPNHILHALLTVVTGGLWLIVWIPIAIRNKRRPV